MRLAPALAIMTLLPALFGCLVRSGAGMPETNLPLEAHAYQPLSRLMAEGYFQTGSLTSRPICRSEAARLLNEAAATAGDAASLPELDWLRSALALELEDLARGTGTSYLRPLEEVRLQYQYLGGAGDLENRSGRDYHEHHNLHLGFSSRFVFGALSGYALWEGRWLQGSAAAPEELAGRLQEGYLKLSLGPWSVEYGRQSLWWGPGRHGALLLSNNAGPLDLVRIKNDEPVLLPSILSHLGPAHFEVFWTRLEESRVVPRPYFAGMRATIMPVPCLELGASRTAIFGGRGRPPVTAGMLWDIFTAQGENEPANASNQLASLDWRLRRTSGIQPFEFYGEFGGEDEAGRFFSKDALLVGFYLPRIGAGRGLDLRMEYADTYFDGHGGWARIWYQHNVYKSGYTYEGDVMGHHMGTDGRDLYLELGLYPQAGTRVSLSLDLEERELYSPAPERHAEISLRLERAITERLLLKAGYTHENIKNYGLVSGNNQSGERFFTDLSWRF